MSATCKKNYESCRQTLNCGYSHWPQTSAVSKLWFFSVVMYATKAKPLKSLKREKLCLWIVVLQIIVKNTWIAGTTFHLKTRVLIGKTVNKVKIKTKDIWGLFDTWKKTLKQLGKRLTEDKVAEYYHWWHKHTFRRIQKTSSWQIILKKLCLWYHKRWTEWRTVFGLWNQDNTR